MAASVICAWHHCDGSVTIDNDRILPTAENAKKFKMLTLNYLGDNFWHSLKNLWLIFSNQKHYLYYFCSCINYKLIELRNSFLHFLISEIISKVFRPEILKQYTNELTNISQPTSKKCLLHTKPTTVWNIWQSNFPWCFNVISFQPQIASVCEIIPEHFLFVFWSGMKPRMNCTPVMRDSSKTTHFLAISPAQRILFYIKS